MYSSLDSNVFFSMGGITTLWGSLNTALTLWSSKTGPNKASCWWARVRIVNANKCFAPGLYLIFAALNTCPLFSTPLLTDVGYLRVNTIDREHPTLRRKLILAVFATIGSYVVVHRHPGDDRRPTRRNRRHHTGAMIEIAPTELAMRGTGRGHTHRTAKEQHL